MRSAVPLISAAPLPELSGGVELFVVETRLAYPGAGGADGHQEYGLTVLVLSNPDEASRRRLRAEAPRYVGARTWIAEFPGEGWAAPVAGHLHALDAAFLDLVIGLQEPIGQAALQVRSLMQQLHSKGRHHLGTSVAVVSTAIAQSTMPEQLGWVMAPRMPAAEAAILLHAGLAQLSAPDLIDEVSAEDLVEVWGSAAEPACLAVLDAEHLRLLRPLHGSGGIAAFYLASGTFEQYRGIARDLRAAGIERPRIVAAAGLTLQRPTYAGSTCVIVAAGGLSMLDVPREKS